MVDEPREAGYPDGVPARRLILVTGAGRSGTSTVAGTLHHLGLHVPLPVLNSNQSNPRGFFESTWPLWFHRRIMDKACIEQIDGRPEAIALMRAAVTPEHHEELRDWLAGVTTRGEQIIVKDPRSSWVPGLWADVTEDLGIQIGYVAMLRHPAEVLGSRSTYYSKPRDSMGEWNFAVMNLCGWVNQTINAERGTRGHPRVWVRYHDLLNDWRKVMTDVQEELQVSFNTDLSASEHHPVDDFIDPGLRRHEVTFDDLDLPKPLTDIAETVWSAACMLADSRGRNPNAEAQFDAAATRYAELYRNSEAIARDATIAQVKAAHAEADKQAQIRVRKRVAKIRKEMEEGRANHMLLPRVVRAVRRRAVILKNGKPSSAQPR